MIEQVPRKAGTSEEDTSTCSHNHTEEDEHQPSPQTSSETKHTDTSMTLMTEGRGPLNQGTVGRVNIFSQGVFCVMSNDKMAEVIHWREGQDPATNEMRGQKLGDLQKIKRSEIMQI